MMEMLINLDSKVDQIGQSSTKLSTSFEALDKKADALTTKVTILEGRLDIHGTTLQTAKKTTESVKNTVENYKGDIAGIREEMQAMEKRLNDRLDELARSQNAGFDEINVSQKTFLDRIMHLFKQ
jgi:chromosome segregation ATPase